MTVGEWRFASLLRDYLDDGYLVWYNVPSHGEHRRYPDFLIFHPSHGLWCLEIKDWHMGNIKTINKNSVILKIGDDQLATTANPIEQARDCCFPVIDHMKTDSQLCQTDGKYQGKLRFPWGFGAVMCNWQRSRAETFGRLLPAAPHLVQRRHPRRRPQPTRISCQTARHAAIQIPGKTQ